MLTTAPDVVLGTKSPAREFLGSSHWRRPRRGLFCSPHLLVTASSRRVGRSRAPQTLQRDDSLAPWKGKGGER